VLTENKQTIFENKYAAQILKETINIFEKLFFNYLSLFIKLQYLFY